MEENKRPTFPKGFFTEPRPTISMEEALKDVIPCEWSEEVLKGEKEPILYPVKHEKTD